MESARIMVVDDEPRIREMIREYLTASGFDVVEAEDGMTAISIFEKNPPRFDGAGCYDCRKLMVGRWYAEFEKHQEFQSSCCLHAVKSMTNCLDLNSVWMITW